MIRAATGGSAGAIYRPGTEVSNMLRWALIFFVFALIAGVFGFGGIAAGAAEIAKILFYIFLAIFAVSLIMHLVRGSGAR